MKLVFVMLALLSSVASANESEKDWPVDLNDHLQAKRQVRRFRVRRGVTRQVSSASIRKRSFSIGPALLGGLQFGRVSSSEGFKTTPQYAAGVMAGYKFSSSLLAEISGLYEILSFSRTLDGSGAISDPNPPTFRQKNSYFGIKADFSYCVDESWGGEGELLWWITVGAEYLLGLSGKQSSSLGGEVDLKPKGLVFLYGGTTATYTLSDSMQINGKLQGFWHVTAQDAMLFGLRLSVALQFSLL